MASIVSTFVAGFILAQSGWWFAARNAISAENTEAFGGAPELRFILIYVVEILASAAIFGVAMGVALKGRPIEGSPKAWFIAFFAGAITSTLAAPPFALIPRIVDGEAQLLVYIVAAAILSALFGVLVAMAFRGPARPATDA